MSKSDRDNKIAFAIAPIDNGVSLLLVGVPQQAWDYMKEGKTHTIDLTTLGLPIKVALYGGESHKEVMVVLKDYAKNNEIPYLDERDKDFSIKMPDEKEKEK